MWMCGSLAHFKPFHICCLADSTHMCPLLQLPAPGPTQPPGPSSVDEGSLSPTGLTSKGGLDTMLGLLQSDLSRRGIPTQAKGLCGSCNKAIAGQVSGALGAGRQGPTDPSSPKASLCAIPLINNSGRWVLLFIFDR